MTYSAGKHWSALGVPVAEPYQPPTDRHPGGWPKTGTAGARETMAVDAVLPPPLPARPYVVIHHDAARLADGIARLEWAADATKATEAQAAAVRLVHDAISDAVHRGLLARAIGWFRR